MKRLFTIFATFAMLCAVGCEEQGDDNVNPNDKPNTEQPGEKPDDGSSDGGEPSAEDNKIYYTTFDGKKLFPYTTEPTTFGAILVSNTYEDGQGVLTFDDTITSIGEKAFYRCTSLASITIPDSVTSIGDEAFWGCSSLTSITIPDSVTSIGDFAFATCKSLTSITIPDSVTSIGNFAFYNCSSLKSVYCKPTTPPTVGSSMFNENASGRKIYVPAGSVNAYKSAEYWSEYADSIVAIGGSSVEGLSISDITPDKANSYFELKNGLVVAVGSNGYILADNSGCIFVYGSGDNVAVGDRINISGTVTIHSSSNKYGNSFGTPEFQASDSVVEVVSSGNVVPHNPAFMNGTNFDALANQTVSKEIEFIGTLSISGNYINVTGIDGATLAGSLKYVNSSDYSSLNGSTVIVKGYFVGISASSTFYVNVLPYSVEEYN